MFYIKSGKNIHEMNKKEYNCTDKSHEKPNTYTLQASSGLFKSVLQIKFQVSEVRVRAASVT